MTTTEVLFQKWVMTCQTEGVEVYTDYIKGETVPTVCPNDNTHTINVSSIRISDRHVSNSVHITNNAHNNVGWFKSKCIDLDIPAGTPGDKIIISRNMGYGISVYNIDLLPDDTNIGDRLCIYFDNPSPIGVLEFDTVIGSTQISVIDPQSGLSTASLLTYGFNILIGVNLGPDPTDPHYLDDTVNIGENIYTTYNGIETNGSMDAVYPAGTPIFVRIYRLQNYHFRSSNYYVPLGERLLGSTNIPKDSYSMFCYYNNDGLAKIMSYNIEFQYPLIE